MLEKKLKELESSILGNSPSVLISLLDKVRCAQSLLRLGRSCNAPGLTGRASAAARRAAAAAALLAEAYTPATGAALAAAESFGIAANR